MGRGASPTPLCEGEWLPVSESPIGAATVRERYAELGEALPYGRGSDELEKSFGVRRLVLVITRILFK